MADAAEHRAHRVRGPLGDLLEAVAGPGTLRELSGEAEAVLAFRAAAAERAVGAVAERPAAARTRPRGHTVPPPRRPDRSEGPTVLGSRTVASVLLAVAATCGGVALASSSTALPRALDAVAGVVDVVVPGFAVPAPKPSDPDRVDATGRARTGAPASGPVTGQGGGGSPATSPGEAVRRTSDAGRVGPRGDGARPLGQPVGPTPNASSSTSPDPDGRATTDPDGDPTASPTSEPTGPPTVHPSHEPPPPQQTSSPTFTPTPPATKRPWPRPTDGTPGTTVTLGPTGRPTATVSARATAAPDGGGGRVGSGALGGRPSVHSME